MWNTALCSRYNPGRRRAATRSREVSPFSTASETLAVLSLMLRIRKCPGPVTFASAATADAMPGVNVQASEDDVCTTGRLARARSMVNSSTSAAPTQADSEGRVLSHARRPPRARDPAAANNPEWLINWAICCASSEGTAHPSENMRGPVSVVTASSRKKKKAADTHKSKVLERNER